MFTETINGITLTFETNPSVFSPRCIDKGTRAMLVEADFSSRGKVLDLGCGYGAAGIYAAQIIGGQNVVMSDIDENCVALAGKNAALNGAGDVKIILSDGFKQMDDTGFSLILSNPPYHADFSLPKHFIEKGFNRLLSGGMMMMVTKRERWYRNKLTAIFGGVRVKEIDGYYIFSAKKHGTRYANTAVKRHSKSSYTPQRFHLPLSGNRFL
jgi:16S rRNA (guanine1207-N2)-methyltransferase